MTLTLSFLNSTTSKPEIYIDRADLAAFDLGVTTDSTTTVPVTELRVQFPAAIFSRDDVARMGAAGWAASAAGLTLTLTRADGVGFDAANPLRIAVSTVQSERIAATNGQVVLHLGGDIASTTLFLLRYPAGAAKFGDMLDARLLPVAEVFRTPAGANRIENVLGLLLKNKQPDQPLVSKPWSGGTPTVLASFVYGEGIGALTTAGAADSDPYSAWQIDFSVEETYQDGKVVYEWTARQEDPGVPDATPIWSLQPVDENTEVLGPRSGANVRFKIAALSTRNITGSTQLYLQFSNFPGYDDGYLTLDLEKVEPSPTIVYFDGNPSYVQTLGDSVTVRWRTFDVAAVVLQIGDKQLKSTDGDIDVEQGSYTQAITRTTQFTLLAYEKVSDAQPQHSLSWTGHVPDAHILDFHADPHDPVVGSPATLRWRTEAALSGEIRDGTERVYTIPADALAAGSKVLYPQRSTTYTLSVRGEGAPPDQSLRLFYLETGWSSRTPNMCIHAEQGPVLFATEQGLILVGGQSLNGIFSSADGEIWNQVGVAPFSARADAAGTVHAQKLWLMGGTGSDKTEHDVWQSDDGLNWRNVTPAAAWPARARCACVSFKDKLWVLGGLDQNLSPCADIWNSTDGITWSQVTPAGGAANCWSARSSLAVAVHHDKLWLFGGLLADGSVSNELWVSDDGIQWSKQRTGGRFSEIGGRQQAVLASIGDSLYLLGGIDGRGTPLNDLNVLGSGGWHVATGPSATWGVHRCGYAVFRNALWLIGGLNFDANNDWLWTYYPQ